MTKPTSSPKREPETAVNVHSHERTDLIDELDTVRAKVRALRLAGAAIAGGGGGTNRLDGEAIDTLAGDAGDHLDAIVGRLNESLAERGIDAEANDTGTVREPVDRVGPDILTRFDFDDVVTMTDIAAQLISEKFTGYQEPDQPNVFHIGLTEQKRILFAASHANKLARKLLKRWRRHLAASGEAS